jgi:hypothetical protein
MGDDHKGDLFRRDSVLLHLMEDPAEVTGMTWIDEDGHLPIDHISITIVLIGILPKIGIEVFFKFHKIDLLFMLSINDQEGGCQIKS